jgi:hypothetical protein
MSTQDSFALCGTRRSFICPPSYSLDPYFQLFYIHNELRYRQYVHRGGWRTARPFETTPVVVCVQTHGLHIEQSREGSSVIATPTGPPIGDKHRTLFT